MEHVQIELQMVHADDGLEGVLTMLSRTPHTAQRVSCGAVRPLIVTKLYGP
jgi:hypothetical protein